MVFEKYKKQERQQRDFTTYAVDIWQYSSRDAGTDKQKINFSKEIRCQHLEITVTT